MMNALTHRLLVIVAIFAMLINIPLAHGATFYPDVGALYYDGQYYASSYLYWGQPGGWSVSDPAYEHDFIVRNTYFSSCTSRTDLPNGYDDCPTAGVSENTPTHYAFSFGSFHARNIQAQRWYYGSWNFSGGSASSSDFKLKGQEGNHYFCPFDSIWCMNGIRSSPDPLLLQSPLIRGQPCNVCWGHESPFCGIIGGGIGPVVGGVY